MNSIIWIFVVPTVLAAARCDGGSPERASAVEFAPPQRWEFPASLLPTRGIAEPRVTVETEERAIATALARAELVRFVHSIGELSRGAFFIAGESSAPIAVAQEARPLRDPQYRTWIVAHDGRHLQVTAVQRSAGWRTVEVLDDGSARTLQECTRCLPEAHRSGDAVGPPFLIDGRSVRWRETYFDGVPFSSLVALFAGASREFRIVDEPDGTQTLRATFATRTTNVPQPTSMLRTAERPDCAVDVQYRARWLIRPSGDVPQIEIDSVAPGVVRCCGVQAFSRPQPRPLCVTAATR